MGQIVLKSRMLTEAVVHYEHIRTEAINAPWCVILYTKFGEIWAKGYPTKEEAEKELQATLTITRTEDSAWSLYGLYHHQKPLDVVVETTFIAI